MRAIALAGEASVDEALSARPGQPQMAGRALAAKVSTREPYVFSDAGRARIAVVDYGCKRSILNRLAWAGRRGHRLSRTTSTRTSSPATTASCSRTAPATRSRSRTSK